MRKVLTVCAVVAMILAVSGVAQATIVTYNDALSLQSTDFSKTMSVSQFDSSLGTLTQVKVSVTGQLNGGGGYESMSPYSGGTFNYLLNQQLDIKLGTDSLLSKSSNLNNIINIPSISAYDGVLDFAGTSGDTIAGIDDTDLSTYIYTTTVDMAQFIGTNQVIFDVDAIATSTHYQPNPQGPITMTFSNAGASVEVEYSYVPEPATLCLLGLGGLLLRRRKSVA